MRRLHGNVRSGIRVDPSSEHPAARKGDTVNQITFDYCNLQIPIQRWRYFEPLPGQIGIRPWTKFVVAW
ncbi:hypothetical protein [Bradyrhizobium sp. SBR1B]|uniref:hypothetical protein n=1 Tax=Bradyrhizobium sp. SBR1B TaxID=2663836 RepID=UPI0016068AA6|nr:hypothetical protein [Bradyrhizobium sp. SBR1B]MBB4380323.1 hypothetical protein [Bradyrhizobium sp. SBR1B]